MADQLSLSTLPLKIKNPRDFWLRRWNQAKVITYETTNETTF